MMEVRREERGEKACTSAKRGGSSSTKRRRGPGGKGRSLELEKRGREKT
jgi:hypothetical protein